MTKQFNDKVAVSCDFLFEVTAFYFGGPKGVNPEQGTLRKQLWKTPKTGKKIMRIVDIFARGKHNRIRNEKRRERIE